MENIRNFNLLDILPPNLQSDTTVQNICASITSQLQTISTMTDNIRIISKLSQQPSEVIDNLAWQWDCIFYDDSLPLATRRALVQNSLIWHFTQGTAACVQDAVSTVLSAGVVTEWFNYDGSPYHFRVQTGEIMSSDDIYNQLLAVINATKNIRSWLDGVVISRQWSGEMYIGGAVQFGKTITMTLAVFPAMSLSDNYYIGGAIYFGKTITVQ
jgi:phage tail P2-like protein